MPVVLLSSVKDAVSVFVIEENLLFLCVSDKYGWFSLICVLIFHVYIALQS